MTNKRGGSAQAVRPDVVLDLAEWGAKSERRSTSTERYHPELVPLCMEFLALRRAGTMKRSIAAFWREILVPQGYSKTAGTLTKDLHQLEAEGVGNE